MQPQLSFQSTTQVKWPISLFKAFTLSGPHCLLNTVKTTQPDSRPSAIWCQLSFRCSLLLLPLEFPEWNSATMPVLLSSVSAHLLFPQPWVHFPFSILSHLPAGLFWWIRPWLAVIHPRSELPLYRQHLSSGFLACFILYFSYLGCI